MISLSVRRFLLSVCLLLFAFSTQAQFEHLLHRTHADRYVDLRKIIDHFDDRDTTETFRSLAALRKAAQKAGDQELLLETDFMHTHFDVHLSVLPQEVILSEIESLLVRAREAHNLQIEIRSLALLRTYYWFELRNYEKAFEVSYKVYELLPKINAVDLPEKAPILEHFGESYYFFADYANAIRYSRESLAEPVITPHLGVHNNARNTIGLSFIELGELDSADVYFNAIIGNVGLHDYNVWKGIAQGGLGLTAYMRGNYEQAAAYLNDNIKQAILISDLDQAGKSLTTLSDIYFRQGKIGEASVTMQRARKSISTPKQQISLEQLFQVYSKVYAAKGDLALSSTYLDSANFIRQRLDKEFAAIQVLRAWEKSQMEAHEAEMQQASAEQHIKTLERNVLLILILLLVVVALYFYKVYYYRTKEKQQKVAEQLSRAETELNFATIQLEEFTRNISEKNQLVEELTAKYGARAGDEAMQELQKLTILTDDQWDYFRSLFDKIHTGYLSRLREKLPGLTPAETRFMALAKLNLTSKEMASTLGISVQSVRVIRHRLRKKLELSEEADITQVVGSI